MSAQERPETARNPLDITDRVLTEVLAERVRQDDRWGERNHRDGTGPDAKLADYLPASLAAHEARELLHRQAEMGIAAWFDVLGEAVAEALAEPEPVQLRARLVRVAAEAVAWVEAIDRRPAAGTDGVQR